MRTIQALPLSLADFDTADFWLRVDRGASTDCWPWTGSLDGQGYGRLRPPGRNLRAHRLSCIVHGIPLTVDQVVDHLCRNKRCVNPAHLEPTTVQINTARGEGPTADLALARLSGTCVKGHVLALVGLHKQRGGATCAECGRERVRRYKARKAAVSA